MAGKVLRLSGKVTEDENSVEYSLVDENGKEYTVEDIMKLLYSTSRKVVDEAYEEDRHGTDKV